MTNLRRRILVNGIVQGVGFRPFVYNLGLDEQLAGFVTNTSGGVVIEIQGPVVALDSFIERLSSQAPPLSIIVSVDCLDINLVDDEAAKFYIKASEDAPGTSTLIPPDVATCVDCLREIRDPENRRHGYAFTNCTNCGPRWTIIGRIPYDRPFTSMAHFKMCALCQAEYNDPQDRRFHAQPNACQACGPKVWLESVTNNSESIDINHPLKETARLLAGGSIVAIKGLGGFHLAVRADSETAVGRLRERKHREAKPLAVMVTNLEQAKQLAHVDEVECRLITSVQAPITLLSRKDNTEQIAENIAADHNRLGVMLPYTPLHHLLFDELAKLGITALVMTSGNASEEPICLDNNEAKKKLADIADWWLLHDRDIVRRADDSVVQALIGKPHFYRRSRGYAPVPVFLSGSSVNEPILAVGPEQKNTVCLLKENRAFISPHIGDLENLSAFDFFRQTVDTLQSVFEAKSKIIAHDKHPGYFSTMWSNQAAEVAPLTLIPVQHHHAHMAAVMAEHKLNKPVIGLIMDGTGYGDDGTIWGGEILVGDTGDYVRVGHFDPVPLPGGEAAIKAPWRIAVSYLRHAQIEQAVVEKLPFLADKPVAQVWQILDKKINSPETSSCGRLFDAVAALTGLWSEVKYEAQAAIELMALTDLESVKVAKTLPGVLPVENKNSKNFELLLILPVTPIIKGVLELVNEGASAAEVSSRFHQTLIQLLVAAAIRANQHTGLKDVVLGGGVFQNEILMAGVQSGLKKTGLTPWRPQQTPANDGAIALGQAVVARSKIESQQKGS